MRPRTRQQLELFLRWQASLDTTSIAGPLTTARKLLLAMMNSAESCAPASREVSACDAKSHPCRRSRQSAWNTIESAIRLQAFCLSSFACTLHDFLAWGA